MVTNGLDLVVSRENNIANIRTGDYEVIRKSITHLIAVCNNCRGGQIDLAIGTSCLGGSIGQ